MHRRPPRRCPSCSHPVPLSPSSSSLQCSNLPPNSNPATRGKYPVRFSCYLQRALLACSSYPVRPSCPDGHVSVAENGHHSAISGRGSPNVGMNAVSAQALRQNRNGSVGIEPSNTNPQGAQSSPQQSQGSAIPPQQSQQQRSAYPWSQRRLALPPPVTIAKPGVPPPTTPSPSPFPRYGHALPATATQTGELFLFGGLVRDTVRNDLYLFSTRDLSATLLQTAGEIPSPRVGHASALVGSVLIVWGGDTKTNSKAKPADKQDDGLYLLNLGAFAFAFDVRSLSSKVRL